MTVMCDTPSDDNRQPVTDAQVSTHKQSKRGRPRTRPLVARGGGDDDVPVNVVGPVTPYSCSSSSFSSSTVASQSCSSSSLQAPTISVDSAQVATTSSNMGQLTDEHKLNRSARHMRNLAEKMRRDKLNTYVSELAAIVPPVADSSKKVDKTSVLRLAANFIRMHNMLGSEASVDHLPYQAQKGLMETLDNKFLLVATNTGKIVFVSDAIEQTFGHGQMELLGCSLYSFMHPDDCDLLRTQLTPNDSCRRSFFCRFAEKSLNRYETRNYDIIHIQGTLRSVSQSSERSVVKQEVDGSQELSLPTDDTPLPLRHRRSTRHYGSLHISEDSSGSEECEEGRAPRAKDTHLLVALVHLIKERPLTELSRVESMRDEYITRHDACGTIIYTDHRISYVSGYMPETVCGASAFMYMHPNDLLWSMVAQKQMLGTDHGQGMVTYRLRCQDNSYVTLQSRGYLEFNKQTGQFESFVCINSVVDEKHSQEEIRKQRRQLLPVIAGSTVDDLITKLTPEFPVEIMQMVQGTLGQKSIRQLLAAMAKYADKKPPSDDGLASVSITEVREGDSGLDVESVQDDRPMCHEEKSSNLSFSEGKSLTGKSTKKKWVTLNKGPYIGKDSSCQIRNSVDGKSTLKRNLPASSSQQSYLGSESDNVAQASHVAGVRDEDVRSSSSKRARHSLSQEPQSPNPDCSSLWLDKKLDSFGSVPANIHVLEPPIGNTNMVGDKILSQQARLEFDARRKRQMLQMEQMAYRMKQIHVQNSMSNSPTGIPGQPVEYKQQYPPNMSNPIPSFNVDQPHLQPPHVELQHPELQVPNLLPTSSYVTPNSPSSFGSLLTPCTDSRISYVLPTTETSQSLNVPSASLPYCTTKFDQCNYLPGQPYQSSQTFGGQLHYPTVMSSPANTMSSGPDCQNVHSYASLSPSSVSTTSSLVSPCAPSPQAGGEGGLCTDSIDPAWSQSHCSEELQNQSSLERPSCSSLNQQTELIAQEEPGGNIQHSQDILLEQQLQRLRAQAPHTFDQQKR